MGADVHTKRNRILIIVHIVMFFSMAAQAAAADEPTFDNVLAGMRETFANLKDYQCLYHLYSTDGKKARQISFTYYFKKPKQIRMDVSSGKYLGAMILYNPAIQEKQVRVRLCNPALAFLQKRLRRESLDLDNVWVTDARGMGVHESDLPAGKGSRQRNGSFLQ